MQKEKTGAVELTPELTILQLYEMGIENCRNKNIEKVQEVILALIQSLDFKYELAESFHAIYELILELIGNEDYEQINDILNELRNVWNDAVVNQTVKN